MRCLDKQNLATLKTIYNHQQNVQRDPSWITLKKDTIYVSFHLNKRQKASNSITNFDLFGQVNLYIWFIIANSYKY